MGAVTASSREVEHQQGLASIGFQVFSLGRNARSLHLEVDLCRHAISKSFTLQFGNFRF